MKPHSISPIVSFIAMSACCFIGVSCKKPAAPAGPPPAAPRLTTQLIVDNPSPLLQKISASPIQWRQYTPVTVQYAKESNKLLLLFVSSNTQLSAMSVFDDIASDAATVHAINEEFVPVLVDAESSREMGILATMLCAEIRKPISFPFMMWTTADGNPITWLPLGGGNPRDITLARFHQAQAVVSRMWSEERDYMLGNSAKDNQVRRERLKSPEIKTMLPSENQAFFASTLRTTHSFYDSLSGNFENMGTLLPTSMQDFFAESALSPNLTEAARRDSVRNVVGNAAMLQKSAAIDFLDGGFYSSRTDQEWNTVATDRNAFQQARAIRSFATMSRATGDPGLLAVAERAMQFQEAHFVLADATVSLLAPISFLPNEAYYWSEDELKKSLSAEEYALLKIMCAPSALGNVPSESDPRRLLFRLNILTLRVSLAEACKQLSLAEPEAQARFASLREKLLAQRAKKLPAAATPVAHAQSTLLTVSAYTALFTASADDRCKEKAVAMMNAFRKQFHSTAILQCYPNSADPSTTDARAGLLANAAQTALDLYDITLDVAWLEYTDQLFAALVKDHLVEGKLEETPPSSRFLQLPIVDRTMIFDQSSIGMMKQNIARVSLLDRKIDPALVAACQLTHEEISASAVTHSDYLLGLLYQDFYTIITIPADAPEALRRAISLLPPRLAARKVVAAGGNEGKVMVSRPGQPDLTITEPGALSALFTP